MFFCIIFCVPLQQHFFTSLHYIDYDTLANHRGVGRRHGIGPALPGFQIRSGQHVRGFPLPYYGSQYHGFYGLSSRGSLGGDSAKLLLTTGLCGGFTTFSTFCNENLSLMRGGHALATLLYTSGSVVLGFIAVAVGYWIAEKL